MRKDDGADAFWVLESNDNGSCRLREYRVDDDFHPTSRLRWTDINTSPSPGVFIDMHYGRMAYDGDCNVFLADFNNSTVHLFNSLTGEHQRQLLSLRDGLDGPRSLSVDKGQRLLCVGQRKGEIKVFMLTDGRSQSSRKCVARQRKSHDVVHMTIFCFANWF